MFQCHRLRALFYLNTFSLSQLLPTPKCHLLLLRHHPPSPSPTSLSTTTTTTTTDQQSFIVSYLTNNCGLSPQASLRASKRIRFRTAEKPDSVIAFFKNHGFSTSQIHSIVVRAPELLAMDPIKTVLPKFDFLASKGASPSDIVVTVSRSPRFLRASLEKRIIPAFELVRNFCTSDKKAVACVIACPTSVSDPRLKPNVKLLLDSGVSHRNIYHLLRMRPSVLCSTDLSKVVEEVKGLGFDPSKLNFSVALLAKKAVSESKWDAKVSALKTWGWSEDAILHAFRRQPSFMLRSTDKLNAVMNFWIDRLGWDPLPLLAAPGLFGHSIEKRLAPRASVVRYLLSKGLMKKDASLVTPFSLTDEMFLQKYVMCFEEETSNLLRLLAISDRDTGYY